MGVYVSFTLSVLVFMPFLGEVFNSCFSSVKCLFKEHFLAYRKLLKEEEAEGGGGGGGEGKKKKFL